MQHTMSSENENPAALSQATVSNHPNISTLILSLSEGRAGEAWEHLKKKKVISL
jgi:hypothetical protein